MPPWFIDLRLLTALYKIAACPVMGTAGMLSPVMRMVLLLV